MLSAAAAPALFVSGCRSLVLKKAPCFVPWLCRNEAATESHIQYDCALRFMAQQEP